MSNFMPLFSNMDIAGGTISQNNNTATAHSELRYMHISALHSPCIMDRKVSNVMTHVVNLLGGKKALLMKSRKCHIHEHDKALGDSQIYTIVTTMKRIRSDC